MSIERFIAYLSIFGWLFTPIRNFGTRYFIYFLVLAFEDPANIIILSNLHISHAKVLPLFTLLLLYSLVEKKHKMLLVICAIVFLILTLFWDFGNQTTILLNGVLHIFILGIFISDFLSYFDVNLSINLFLVLLISYEFIGISKNLLWILDLSKGIVIFYIGAFLQIFLGIAFTIWNVNNSPKFKIKGMET